MHTACSTTHHHRVCTKPGTTFIRHSHFFLQAIEAAREQSFDVILMDVEMPVMGGVDATKILKQEQPSTPIVLVTASTDDVTLVQCRSCGADHIMPKPFNIEMLSEMLKQMALYVVMPDFLPVFLALRRFCPSHVQPCPVGPRSTVVRG